MMAALSIAQRELLSFFRLPIGWVLVALYALLSGFVFAIWTLRPGEPASMQSLVALSTWLMIFIAPAVSMRLLSEEFRSGAIEPLMTAPVSDWQVAIGKYLAGVAFLCAMLSPMLFHAGALIAIARPDVGPMAAGFLGLLLLGMVYVAVGLLASALTANQVVAFLGTLFFLLFMRIASSQGAIFIGAPLDRWLLFFSIDERMRDFSTGLIDTAHIGFFLALSALFLTLTVVALEFRRWR